MRRLDFIKKIPGAVTGTLSGKKALSSPLYYWVPVSGNRKDF